MIISKIKLFNFRQFKGDHSITLSANKDKKITVFHGQNGVGKTTILNAIFWCFYGDTLPGFKGKHELINHDVEKEQKDPTASVSLEFSDNETEYRIIRTLDKGSTAGTLEAFKIINGSQRILKTPEVVIQRMVPQEMAPYFFFHGEGLNNLATSSKRSFRSAIRSILGFTAADSGIDLLEKLQVSVEKAFSKQEKLSKQVQNELKRSAELGELLRDKRNKSNENKSHIELTEGSLRDIDKQLAAIDIEDIAELVEKRDKLRKEIREIPGKITSYENTRMRMISKMGWSILGYDSLNQAAEVLEEFRSKRMLPADYNDSFINKLLERGTCICGTELNPGSNEIEELKQALGGASTSEQEDRVLKASYLSESMKDVRKDFIDGLTTTDFKIGKLEQTKSDKERELESLQARIDKIDDTEKNRLEAERGAAIKLNEDLRNAQQILNLEIKQLDSEYSQLKSKTRSAVDSELLKIFDSKKGLIERLITKLKNIIDVEEAKAIIDIQALINEKLERYSTKDYFAEVEDDFSFKMLRSDGRPVHMSDGETMLLNISFISALIQLAREKAENINQEFFIQGMVAPLVIDAPFGELDTVYREAVAQFLPQSTEQLVVLVSSSHWGEEVENGFIDLIGKEYLLTAEHKFESDPDKKPVTVKVRGESFPVVIHSAPESKTSVKEIFG